MLYTPLYVRYLTFSSTLRHRSIFFIFSNILSVTNVVSSPKASIHEHTERFTTNQQPTLLHWICNILMLNPFQIQIISLYWTKPKEASDNVFSYIIKTTIHSCVYIKHNSTNLRYKFEKKSPPQCQRNMEMNYMCMYEYKFDQIPTLTGGWSCSLTDLCPLCGPVLPMSSTLPWTILLLYGRSGLAEIPWQDFQSVKDISKLSPIIMKRS